MGAAHAHAAAASAAHAIGGGMSGLSSGVGVDKAASAVSVATAAAAMQFPLTSRRKRRVLFTHAQVSNYRDIATALLPSRAGKTIYKEFSIFDSTHCIKA